MKILSYDFPPKLLMNLFWIESAFFILVFFASSVKCVEMTRMIKFRGKSHCLDLFAMLSQTKSLSQLGHL